MNDSHSEAVSQGDFPVLLSRNLFDDHFRVVGTTGGGKTALFIDPRVIELVRQKSPGLRVEHPSREQPPPTAEGS